MRRNSIGRMTCTAWLFMNVCILFMSWHNPAEAVPCDVSSITNTSDCATTQNYTCKTQCNSQCPDPPPSGRTYTGNSHKTRTSGQGLRLPNGSVKCWDDFTCSSSTLTGQLCKTSPTGSKYCDPNNPASNCLECLPGTLTPGTIVDAQTGACVEE